MLRRWGLAAVLPFILGFEPPKGREALEAALHNLYGPDVLAAVELEMDSGQNGQGWIEFAYGRKQSDGETKTLVYTVGGRRETQGALLFQSPGKRDRIFVNDGKYGQVRPLSAGDYDWPLFGSDFSYDDFRAHAASEYRIEVLGPDTIQGEPCRVLRLRPLNGPYRMMVVWLSTRRPVIIRTDYFDAQGLWKRRTLRVDRIVRNFEWWVPMEDEMVDLRLGRRTVRRIRNILLDIEVPDEIFTIPQLARGRVPSF
jgi:hypothetical protein